MNKPFFTAEDFNDAHAPTTPQRIDTWHAAKIANGMVEELIAENERLKDANCWSCEDKEKIRKLTEQNRELESIISKRVPKLEKILSIMKEALASYVRWCPFGCVEGDCGAEWDAEPKPCDACKPAREALAAVKKLEEK